MKIGEKLPKNDKRGLIFWGKVQNGRRSTPINRCFQPANFDTPHGHHEFCMQFWPAETDSHAVSHFMELCMGGCYSTASATAFVRFTVSILSSHPWSEILIGFGGPLGVCFRIGFLSCDRHRKNTVGVLKII